MRNLDDFLYQLNMLRSLLKSFDAPGIRYRNVLKISNELHPKIALRVKQMMHEFIGHDFTSEKSNFDIDKEIDHIILLVDDICSGPKHG